MKRAEIGAVVRWKGELVEVIGIADGRSIIMRPIGAEPCTLCGHVGDIEVLERSPLFQENVAAVATVVGA